MYLEEHNYCQDVLFEQFAVLKIKIYSIYLYYIILFIMLHLFYILYCYSAFI